MSWQEDYDRKRTTAAEAVSGVRSGERIYMHPGCATPEVLVQALLERAGSLEDVEIIHLKTLGNADYSHRRYDGIFRTVGLFIGENVRDAVAEGRADYMPIFLHEVESLFESGACPLDHVFLQLSPPDKYGYMSLGVGVDCTLTAAKNCRRVIAEVNPRMPRTHGQTFLHVSEVHGIVEVDHELPELHPAPANEVQVRIARNVASLIPNGATLQLGIGAIPDAVLASLTGHRDLGLHTEMFSDGVIPLIESGVMNGAAKSIHAGKLIAGFVLGTRKLFNFVDDNPLLEFHPNKYVCDPFVISRNRKMVAINSALQVDITGQVCADSIGAKLYSGVGGQVDFIRGAAHSEGGKPIIALPSTAKKGTVSRIAPILDPGAGVVTSRADVHYVVTEHGVAFLHGKTLRERTEALIGIADPKFREMLYDFAYEMHYLRPRLVPAG
ncbi:MAG: acetyl-CoA hydrolase/transferase family protein [Candidatus Solibacter usitatus]|nr:acetyl-CoA hydrolase/transferase family protein [Candidatus Solibacter usitatus]